ncbi:F-box protein At3g56470-like [Andrographis paniculata]|uniref:F-box protein At3g56470-like n=1 Tax=Andrographis paniculata TaxID=175694 RepID=UPI0021E964F6|nr:F-box protein At3g56470-like [Andrographis paniculata]
MSRISAFRPHKFYMISGKRSNKSCLRINDFPRRPNKKAEESNIPVELLQNILTRLSLVDNLQASGVCHRWMAVAKSIRVSNKHPWIMYHSWMSKKNEFYDPHERKSHYLRLSGIKYRLICYSNNSWLLLYSHIRLSLTLYIPYTQKCGDASWTVNHFENLEPFVSSNPNQWTFCNGRFYCLSQSGQLECYDPDNSACSVVPVERHECIRANPLDIGERVMYMAEHAGDIYLTYACPFLNPFVHMLNTLQTSGWEIEDLGGLTIFANYISSFVRTDMIGFKALARTGINSDTLSTNSVVLEPLSASIAAAVSECRHVRVRFLEEPLESWVERGSGKRNRKVPKCS